MGIGLGLGLGLGRPEPRLEPSACRAHTPSLAASLSSASVPLAPSHRHSRIMRTWCVQPSGGEPCLVRGAIPGEGSHHRRSHSRQSRGMPVEPQCAAHCTCITRTELAARAMVRVGVRVSYPYPFPLPLPLTPIPNPYP